MNNLAEPTQASLLKLAEKLRDESPLNVPKDDFIDSVRSQVKQKYQRILDLPDIEAFLNELRQTAQVSQRKVYFRSVGTVLHIGNGVATLSGLPAVQLEELVTFPNGVQGMVQNLDKSSVDVILLGPDKGIGGGDLAEATGKRLNIPVGYQFLGRVISPMGKPLIPETPIIPSEYRPVERIAPGVVERAPVDTSLHTGTKIIDALFPLGRGQRELIVGDRQTGKTTLALDAIISQRGTEVKCIYVSIGQKKTSVVNVVDILQKKGMMAQTIIIAASPDDPPALRYLAPYAGATLAEFFLDSGMDVLIIYDDLSKHAETYRELSLLLRRPPGREAYPGDIFYLHSRLLERACRLNEKNGGGSITALPIVTTQRGNISSYIVTNLISITDGQIVLDTDLFNKGVKPAINIGKSVSRVGSAAQEPAMKQISKALKLELSQYEEVARFARFGTEVNEATQRQIDRGRRLQSLLGQDPNKPVAFVDQVILFYAVTKGFLDDVPENQIQSFTKEMLTDIHIEEPQAIDQLRIQKTLSRELEEQLQQFMSQYVNKTASTVTKSGGYPPQRNDAGGQG